MGVVDMKVSSGQLDVSKEKNLLVWILGKHCAPETLYVAMVQLNSTRLFFTFLVFHCTNAFSPLLMYQTSCLDTKRRT